MSNESLNMEGATLPSISRIAYMPVTLFSIIMGLTGAASGADASAATTANPPSTAILRILISMPFNDVRRR